MLKTLVMSKFQLYFSKLLTGNKKGKQSKGTTIAFGLLMVYVLCVFVGMSYFLFSALIEPLAQADMEWFIFGFVALTALMLMFIGNIFTAQAQLYGAKDNELLLSMPIPPKYILLSRMILMWIINLGFELVVAIPAYIVYVNYAGFNILSFVSFILIVLALPFLGLALSCIIGFVVQLITSRMKHKNILTTILSVGFMMLYFYFIFSFQNKMNEFLLMSMQMAESTKEILPLIWIGQGVTHGNLLYTLYIILICLIPFVIIYWFLSKNFIKMATTKKSAPKTIYKERAMKTRSGFMAVYKKEMSRFLGLPTYILNAGLGVVFLLIGVVYLIIQWSTVEEMLVQAPMLAEFLIPLAIAAIGMCLSMVIITAPTISLEGKNLWILRSTPIESSKILLAKTMVQISITVPTSFIASVVVAMLAKPSPLMAISLFLAPILISIFFAFMGTLINLKMPKFDWTDEVYAIKQGASTVVTMFGSMGVLILLIAPYPLLLMSIMNIEIYCLILTAVLAVACGLCYKLLVTWGVKVYESL